MKYTKYILFLFALFFAACNINDDVELSKNTGNKIQLVSRIIPFTQYNVLTRADNAEDYISSLDYIILADCRADGDTAPDYRCVYYKSFRGANTVVTIDRDVDFAELKNNGKQNVLQNCIIGVVANYPALYESIEAAARNYKNENGESSYMVDGEVDTESYISEHVIYKGDGNFKDAQFFMTVEQGVERTVGVPSTGLPRMGNYYDVETGSPIVDFLNLPVGSTCDVNLECLFAKMEFLITVDASQNVAGVPNANEFDLTGYTVTNLVKNVDMVGGNPTKSGLKYKGDDDEESSNEYDVEVYSDPIGGGDVTENEGGKEISFVCYLPERYIRPTAAADSFSYPFLNGQPLRDEDKKLRQRYKPLLAHETATYVTLSGVYRNHQGHSFNVDYKIYVGKDNYSNFDVVRNLQYNNNIVIRGIDNSLNQSGNTNVDPVSIDHRVTVTPTLPLIINFRRETLLDAHFEVRPMRIRINGNHASNHATKGSDWKQAVKVEVEYDHADTKRDWIGLERSYGNGVPTSEGYCNNSSNLSAQGKRLYFTTDLTKETLSSGKETFFSNGDNLGYSSHGGQYVIIPAKSTNQCVWVYVDECDEESEASESKNATRQAKIKVTNGHIYIGENQPGGYTQGDFEPCAPPIDYIIKQHLLYKIVSKEDPNRVYYIEHEEEYLHNFDSEDIYSQNQTQFKGMQWGLNDIQLSNQYPAVYLTAQPTDFYGSLLEYFGITSPEQLINQALVEAQLNPKYDFYLTRDIDEKPNITRRDYAGYTFNTEIASYILNTYSTHQGENSTADAKINGIRLDEQPKSAFAYCYNRNKRNANGQVVTQDWYMPSIDELEEIMELAHIQFEDFQGQLYWSCQSAYESHTFIFDYWTKTSVFGQYKQQDDIKGNYFVDDIDRARATRVERENGEFKEILSSASDIFGTLEGELRIVLSLIDKSRSFERGDYIDNENLSFTNYPGNLPRTGTQCRVRAVRRMTTTQ